MNTRTVLAAAVLSLSAAGAMAQEAVVEPYATHVSVASRAEVAEQARLALASGALHEAAQIDPATRIVQPRTREAVRAELRQAIANGEIDRLNAEAWGFDGQRPAGGVPMRVATVR